MKRLEAHCGAGDPLDEAVVLFQYVVEIFDLPDLDQSSAAGEFQGHVHHPPVQSGAVDPNAALDRLTPDDAYWAGLEEQKAA